MGQLSVVIPDDLEQRFRAAVVERTLAGKGKLKDALVEAIKLWLDKTE
jgi:tryptophan synthase beta subunit|tara:strand:+ start:1115 stop:1258 length:144 start_codon:yes stop_codon:yes gene_type:complete